MINQILIMLGLTILQNASFTLVYGIIHHSLAEIWQDYSLVLTPLFGLVTGIFGYYYRNTTTLK